MLCGHGWHQSREVLHLTHAPSSNVPTDRRSCVAEQPDYAHNGTQQQEPLPNNESLVACCENIHTVDVQALGSAGGSHAGSAQNRTVRRHLRASQRVRQLPPAAVRSLARRPSRGRLPSRRDGLTGTLACLTNPNRKILPLPIFQRSISRPLAVQCLQASRLRQQQSAHLSC